MYGLINLVRHYAARHVEKAAELAKRNGLRSLKALRRIVESMAAEADENKAQESDLTQKHPLIRLGEDYGAFWDQHAAESSPPEQPVSPHILSNGSASISREHLPRIWQQASWQRVIEVFDLTVDNRRRRRDDELWLISPFNPEQKASMHVSLSENIFKDFSSGKGGGIMQFCREMLRRKGREMTMFEVARWMVDEGISTIEPRLQSSCRQKNHPTAELATVKDANPAIDIDLRPYLRADHPQLNRRGISASTCRYLGCGFLPQRPRAKTASPLNGRLVFQIRGVKENGIQLQPIVLSHTGRAISREQEDADGKYWSYPFKKGLEIYNQDQLFLDEEARRQANQFGLILVEGFFDVAKLVQADCRNVGALMGATVSAQQIQRLVWLNRRLRIPHILLFLDRDPAGHDGARLARRKLRQHDMAVKVFDWDQKVSGNGQIPESIKDPADLSVDHLRALRRQGII
jgi:DNA primase